MASEPATTIVCRRCLGRKIEAETDILPGIPSVTCNLCNGSGKQPVWAISPDGWEVQFRQRATEQGADVEMQDMIVQSVLPMIRRRCDGQ